MGSLLLAYFKVNPIFHCSYFKIEELEHTKLKLQARLAECESTVDNLSTKLDNLEKSKVKLQTEIESKTL